MIRVIAYAYYGRSCAPYRALHVETRASDTRAVLRRVALRIFGPSVVVAADPVSSALDSAGRNIYGPAGREVIDGGRHWQVWRDGTIVGYVSTYGPVK